MVGRSTPMSDKHFSAVSTNFFKLSGLIFPFKEGSMISSSVPLLLHSSAHSARLTCSFGRLGFKTGLAHRASNRTTPNEYTSDFSDPSSRNFPSPQYSHGRCSCLDLFLTTRNPKPLQPSFHPREC
ncbi:hypothetical protein Ahy_A06g027529 isoform C [Arachis hypogaea]|uniref:Uncharacterized protein n=1 Tax=Arachis hypogaea TaxID=3818 RepID=A0A445CNZ0_ARAHY|nr:hypothetical protein Ahy_A06g027529 isoform C [Arachis hypogaea]